MANRFKQADISALSGRTIFFDANVVIYLFWPVFLLKMKRVILRF